LGEIFWLRFPKLENMKSGSASNLSESDLKYLRAAIDMARRARERGNHPFGALLVDEKGNVILEAENTVLTERDCTGHAETNLVRQASQKFTPKTLAKCTLYTSTEPCPMCAGAIYWSNVSRVVFALSAQSFYAFIGNTANQTLPSCRTILGHGGIEVVGPALEEEAKKVHEGFWK
jgi:tRNA(Arg) A34 adenosine deaminase TadA